MLADEAHKKGMIGLAPTTVLVSADSFEVIGDTFNSIQPRKISYTLPTLLVPGDHIRLDAQLAYVVSQSSDSTQKLQKNPSHNIREAGDVWEALVRLKIQIFVMSDYGHHPTEDYCDTGSSEKAYPDKNWLSVLGLISTLEPTSSVMNLRTSFTSADMTYISDVAAWYRRWSMQNSRRNDRKKFPIVSM